MKYMITWRERPHGSAAEYEAAQKRVLELFKRWEIPKELTFHQFLVRVGEFGGYAVVETDDPAAVHTVTSSFAPFAFNVEQVLDVAEAVEAETRAIEWRESLTDI